ncbi:MAG: hypothetical protein SLAVMIC_00571 [uncultured marine phage]|uniref:Uncharacterized protein n=1 Tax=uncultured marine phage TaxID=707152 RepID=A0A8D9FS94_9VIRU|nr:MAG: hypothetical protein SLAVMIC_00571 [uncultured marine phage]
MKYVKTFEFFDVEEHYDDVKYDIDNIKNVNEIAEKLGEEIEDVPPLGCGTFGCAFALKSGKVMKLTSSVSEAKATNRIKKRSQRKHLVAIYDVRKIVQKIGEEKFPRYVIIQDLVYTLDEEEQDTFEYFKNEFYNDEISTKDFQESVWEENVGLTFMNKIIPQRDSILKDIENSGLYSHEAHSRNVGFDNYGTFKIFDPLMAEVSTLKNKFNKSISV